MVYNHQTSAGLVSFSKAAPRLYVYKNIHIEMSERQLLFRKKWRSPLCCCRYIFIDKNGINKHQTQSNNHILERTNKEGIVKKTPNKQGKEGKDSLGTLLPLFHSTNES